MCRNTILTTWQVAARFGTNSSVRSSLARHRVAITLGRCQARRGGLVQKLATEARHR